MNGMEVYEKLKVLKEMEKKDLLFECERLMNRCSNLETENEKLRGKGFQKMVYSDEVSALAADRIRARENKDYIEADRIRDLLRNEYGIVVRDTKAGSVLTAL
jgi:cysteinyl-tRNA synthetase